MWPRLRELNAFELRILGLPKDVAEQIPFLKARGLKCMRESGPGREIFFKRNTSPLDELCDRAGLCFKYLGFLCGIKKPNGNGKGNGIAK